MKTVIISVRIRDGSYLSAAINSLHDLGYGIEATEYDYGDVDSRPEVLTRLLEDLDDAGFLVIWISGNLEYFKNYSMVLKKAEFRSIPTFVYSMSREVSDPHRGRFPFEDGDYELLYRYALLGGPSNMRGFALWISNRFAGTDETLPEPVRPPAQGVYVKDCDDTSFETHIP